MKSIIIKLDRIFSLIVRKAKRCKICATTEGVEPAHVFGRENLSVRWDFDNAVPLCRRCHSWAHRNIKKFKDIVRKMYGDKRYEALELKANTPRKYTDTELEELYATLEKAL